MDSKLEDKLIIGVRIKLGPKYCKNRCTEPGTIITLVEGEFDYDNGLYSSTITSPSIWDEQTKEYDSIFHLFGNDLEDFEDCEIITE